MAASYRQAAWPWRDVLLTALAPTVWGSTYLVTTQWLAVDHPFTNACWRVLPAGLLLLLWQFRLPAAGTAWRLLALAALNIGVFQGFLFVAAARLPGGLAAIFGAMQPLAVMLLSRWVDGVRPGWPRVAAACLGVLGMALMLLAPTSRWDLWGVMAATLSAASMAGGTFLAQRWSIGLAPLPLTGWQLLLGGLMLLPASLLLEGPWQLPRLSQGLATAYLSLAGALLAYVLWFRGSLRLPAVGVASLGLLSPLTAAVLGWAVLGQNLGPLGWLGFGLALGSVVLLQRLNAPAPVKDGQ